MAKNRVNWKTRLLFACRIFTNRCLCFTRICLYAKHPWWKWNFRNYSNKNLLRIRRQFI